MNVVKLTGQFRKITAYTDGSCRIERDSEWKEGRGYYKNCLLTLDGNFIEVRVQTSCFEHWYKENAEGKDTVKVTGRLCTEISTGTGIVSYYIAIGF